MGAAQNKQRSMSSNRLWLGTAGWNVPSACRDQIGGEGSHLKRYASRLNAVEINSSFYRPHRRTTYERWASDTPDDFRFSVKVPRSITHMLDFAPAVVDRFIEECAGLGPKLAVLLVQLPPKHVFDSNAAQKLFDVLRTQRLRPWCVNRGIQAGLKKTLIDGLPLKGSPELPPTRHVSRTPTAPAAGRACAIFAYMGNRAFTTQAIALRV